MAQKLAIQIDGINDIIEYEKNEQDFDQTYIATHYNSLFTFIGEKLAQTLSPSNNEHDFNPGSGFSIQGKENAYFYSKTEIQKEDNVYLKVDPDDGGGKKFIGTIDEIKNHILTILPKEYKEKELHLFSYSVNT